VNFFLIFLVFQYHLKRELFHDFSFVKKNNLKKIFKKDCEKDFEFFLGEIIFSKFSQREKEEKMTENSETCDLIVFSTSSQFRPLKVQGLFFPRKKDK